MKYLKQFKSLAEARNSGANGMWSPHVDIIDGKKPTNVYSIGIKKFVCGFDDEGYMTGPKLVHEVGDICYWNGAELCFTPYTEWSSSLGVAVAVCVIPTNHATVWGDGKARFISVNGVTETGAPSDKDNQMWWGAYDTRIDTPLTNYGDVVLWDNSTGKTAGSDGIGCLPSDRSDFTGAECSTDTGASYWSEDETNLSPSPYAADGTFNSDYIKTTEGDNAFSDLDGKPNTSTLVGIDTKYTAAYACSKYSDEGVSAGEWYLPAMGELGYLMPRWAVIQAAIEACSGVKLAEGAASYWASSEHTKDSAWSLLASRGRAGCSLAKEDANVYVRPFCALE